MRLVILSAALLLMAVTPARAEKCMGPVINPRFAAFYETNNILPQDLALAAKLYRQSAESGSGDAQFRLAELYAQGRGVRQDYAEAYYWFIIAGNRSKDAKYLSPKAEMQKKLTAAQAAAVDQRAQAWLAEYYGRPCLSVITDGDDMINVKGTASGIKSSLPRAERGDGLAQAGIAFSYWQIKNDKKAYFWRGVALKSTDCYERCKFFQKLNNNMQLNDLTDAEKADLDKEIAAWKPKN